jgi:hypothetical protein
MTAVFVTSIAGLFAWATIVRLWLWLGHADADSGQRARVAGLARAYRSGLLQPHASQLFAQPQCLQ